jgi:outer membrane protein OmpA-like peptidoglycan-associated protein
MVAGNGRRQSNEHKGRAQRAAILGLSVIAFGATGFGLAGCSSLDPIAAYRDVTGASKDDPAKDEPNTANLEAGSQEPFPSVGSVPNPPTRGLTEAQREKLAAGLVADRDNARYVDQQLAQGNAAAVPAPQAKVPEEQLPIAIPDSPAASAPPAAPPPTASGNAASGTAAARPARPSSNFVTGGFAGRSGQAIPTANVPTAPPTPVAADRESALATPAPRAIPVAETPQDPPAPPQLKPLPPPQPTAPIPGAPAIQPPPPAQPTQVGGVPIPPAPPSRADIPSAPVLPAAPPVATAANLPGGKRAKSAEIAEIGFMPGASALSAQAPDKLKDVPGLHQQYGGVLRIVGYASLPVGGTDPAGQQLAAYQAALERAKLIKNALVEAGVPAADIVTEASPIHGTGANADRADIYAEY